MIYGHGLGELDGFLDTLKNFGSGVVKFATAGIYDPSKNRFYVPFSSGMMRNAAQGFVNTSTLGLVRTDKFFNSQTAKTVGAVAGGVAAAATAAVVGRALYTTYGGGSVAPTQGPSMADGKFVSGGVTAAKTAAETGTKSTASLFTLDNVSKTLDIGAKVLSVGAGGAAPQQQPQYAQGGGAPVVVVAGGGGEVYPAALPGSFQTDPYAGLFAPAMYSPSGGGGMMMVPGGGGGVGPPGSEYYVAEDGTVVPVDSATKDIPLWVIIGSGVVLTYVLMSAKKSRKK